MNSALLSRFLLLSLNSSNIARAIIQASQDERERLWKQRLAKIKKQQFQQKIINRTLRINGYSWQSCQLLDITQGENGEYMRELIAPDGTTVSLSEAIAQIYKNGMVMSSSGHFVPAGSNKNIIEISP